MAVKVATAGNARPPRRRPSAASPAPEFGIMPSQSATYMHQAEKSFDGGLQKAQTALFESPAPLAPALAEALARQWRDACPPGGDAVPLASPG